jgi:hypothetical protein
VINNQAVKNLKKTSNKRDAKEKILFFLILFKRWIQGSIDPLKHNDV